jgi:subtilisin family serine protease
MEKQTLFVEFKRSKSAGAAKNTKAALKKSGASIARKKSFLANTTEVGVAKEASASPWDSAHQLYDDLAEKGQAPDFIEPAVDSEIYDKNEAEVKSFKAKRGKYLVNWPFPKDFEHEFAWHLGEQYSQMAKARDFVWAQKGSKKIRVAHIDTGYQLGHPSRPEKLMWKLGKSFLKGEEDTNPGIDFSKGTMAEQDGHGNATLAFLAGGKLSKEDSDGKFEGYFGGIPFAEVVPIRINDTVALIKSDAFVKAIQYAIDTGCEVVTMSMAGLPSKAWARIINKAYEAGVTVVTAAGNSWIKSAKKALPKSLIYPSRYDRVIAACGVAANHQPYVFGANDWPRPKSEGGEWMQGNFGPASKMNTAIAAYTPNVAWGTTNEKKPFTMTGGGTSSATPQVAAAVALWIVHNRAWLDENGYSGTWRQVEAARYALFSTAKKIDKYEKYLGNGVIQVFDALSVQAPKSKLKLSKRASASFTGIRELFNVFFKTKARGAPAEPQNVDMFVLELAQLMYQEPELLEMGDWDLDDPNGVLGNLTKTKLKKLKSVIQKSPNASTYLKDFFSLYVKS